MRRPVTPEEARALLDGTTPGDEWYYSVKWGSVQYVEPVTVIPGGEVDVTEEDAALIVAAPALAAMIAGMREEWVVIYDYKQVGGPATFTIRQGKDSADRPLGQYTARLLAGEKVLAGCANVRIVRRYVTEEEEIS